MSFQFYESCSHRGKAALLLARESIAVAEALVHSRQLSHECSYCSCQTCLIRNGRLLESGIFTILGRLCLGYFSLSLNNTNGNCLLDSATPRQPNPHRDSQHADLLHNIVYLALVIPKRKVRYNRAVTQSIKGPIEDIVCSVFIVIY